MNAVQYLRRREWSMGCGGDENKGQCPECCGVSEAWLTCGLGWGGGWGHKPHCSLASALISLGEKVDYYRPVPGYALSWSDGISGA